MPFLSSALFLFLGLAFGSFGGCLIMRLPTGERIWGRSRCPGCRKALSPWELLPIVSFLLLRGRCRRCSMHISSLYPLVEVATGLLFLLAIALAKNSIHALILALLLWLLLLIAVIDARTKAIPDVLTVTFLLGSLFHAVIARNIDLLGIGLGGGWFAVQWIGSRGKWIGSGDVLLGVGMGAFLPGWEEVLLAIGLAYVMGGSIGGVLLACGRWRRGAHIAFAPFLASGVFLTLLFGQGLLQMFHVL